jgi:nucleotide-binding universal stress UspA family protein
MLNRILVGIDFTELTEAIMVDAQDLARIHGAEIVLTHVMYMGFEAPVAGKASAGYSEFMVLQQEQVRDQLSELCRRFDSDIRARPWLLEGKPAPVLAVAADELEADLVMVGCHGRTGLKRFLIGSVAERTVRFSDRTVMVVKGGHRARKGFHRILVPTDFSAGARHALEVSLGFAASDAHIELLHCWRTPVYLGSLEDTNMGMASLGPEIEREVCNQGEMLLDAYASRRGERTMCFRQVEAKATHGIQDRLESEPFDLVVIGNHGRSSLGRWIIGSVAEVTVRHSPCSVVVVKTDEIE